MKHTCFFLFIAFIISMTAGNKPGYGQLADSPWPKFRHDLKNTGCSDFFGPQTPDTAWILPFKQSYYGEITSSPVIGADGTIYIGTHNQLVAINRWGYYNWPFEGGRVNGNIEASPLIGSDGKIYIGERNKKFYAFNPDGSPAWFYEDTDTLKGRLDLKSSAAIDRNGGTYFGAANSSFYAIHPDGSEKWCFHPTDGYIIYSSPAIDDLGRIYIAAWGGTVYAFAAGELLWKYQIMPIIGAFTVMVRLNGKKKLSSPCARRYLTHMPNYRR